MKLISYFRVLLMLAALAAGSAAVAAEDLGAVRSRMEQRQGTVDAIKDRGLAGENNRGFLEARGAAAAEEQKAIADENADRRTVYAAIAAQTKTDPDSVGRARAQKIAANSKPGVWIQGADGNWQKK